MPIRVVIADDHAMVREGIRLILSKHDNIDVVGEARNGREAIALAETLLPDIIIMDISMSELNGLEATKILGGTIPSVKVIILSMHNTTEFVVRALQAGAWAYIVKDSLGDEVHKAIHAVKHGRRFFGEGVEMSPEDLFKVSGKNAKTPLSSLSRRERETLQLVVDGKSNAAIAEQLRISAKSVETYRSRLMQKLGVVNLPALIKFALQHGITPP